MKQLALNLVLESINVVRLFSNSSEVAKRGLSKISEQYSKQPAIVTTSQSLVPGGDSKFLFLKHQYGVRYTLTLVKVCSLYFSTFFEFPNCGLFQFLFASTFHFVYLLFRLHLGPPQLLILSTDIFHQLAEKPKSITTLSIEKMSDAYISMARKDRVESGEGTYFPALNVGLDKPSTLKFNEVDNESKNRLKELEESQAKISGLEETIERLDANLSNLESENQVLRQQALVASKNEDLIEETEK
ncbi:unnamed protein product [Lactuca virosa]|uniref:Uncharacterized protein n=1 Tax=Lactuca virosa TaxID=75947 RepID=A0AAU9P686_9ASTR|nr:unnamed protein product [Lactuca virosa]